MPSFKAIVIRKSDSGQGAELTDFDEKDLMEGDVTFRVEWSTVNYKDGLAVTGKARVKGDWLVPLPSGLSARDAMAVGTAGYTAMLAVMALERHGITPDRGPVVVTGAAGGVGSVAIALLAKLGFHVIASTGRPQEAP